MSWLFLALLAFLGFGIQNFLYKVSAERGFNSRTVTFHFVLLSTAIIWLIFFLSGGTFRFSKTVIILAVLDSVGFYIGTLTRLEALRFIPVHLAFPLLRTSTLLVAACGVVFFDENFSWQLGVALALVVAAAWLISAERKEDKEISKNYSLGVLLIVVAIVFSAFTNVITKLAAEQTQLLDYMALANSIIVVFSFVEIRVFTGRHIVLPSLQEFYLVSGLAIANLVAWYAYLVALKQGPLNVTAAIAGMGFVVPIVLAAIIYRERLSAKRVLAVFCTVLVLVLLKSE